jgi:hypothetical protein
MDVDIAKLQEQDEQSLVNADVWAHGDFVKDYAWKDLRPAEARLFELHREQLSGRVLELGCGAGRVTGDRDRPVRPRRRSLTGHGRLLPPQLSPGDLQRG